MGIFIHRCLYRGSDRLEGPRLSTRALGSAGASIFRGGGGWHFCRWSWGSSKAYILIPSPKLPFARIHSTIGFCFCFHILLYLYDCRLFTTVGVLAAWRVQVCPSSASTHRPTLRHSHHSRWHLAGGQLTRPQHLSLQNSIKCDADIHSQITLC